MRRDRALKLEVVGDDPGRGGEGLRDRIARSPDLRLVVVDGIPDAQHLCRRIGSVAPGAGDLEVDGTARFDIEEQRRHSALPR